MKGGNASTHTRCYAFAGGGSGGHLTPSIAVAEALLERDSAARLLFLTSGREVDRRVLQNSALATHPQCAVVPLSITQPPAASWSGVRHLSRLVQSTWKCRSLLRQQNVLAMLATGAFASVPGLLAARGLGIPIALFEANAMPGRVNRWWASTAAVKFRGLSCSLRSQSSFKFVGMPVRQSVTNSPQQDAAEPDEHTHQILVVGGSQGSQRLNELVRAAFGSVRIPAGWRVLHQTGSTDPGVSASGAMNSESVRFIGDVPAAMRRSTLVISRSGAVTLGELAATGRPSILVPLSTAAEGHQHQNTRAFTDCGAAVVVDETSPHAVDELATAVSNLIDDSSQRNKMGQAASSLHRDHAADEVARRLIELGDRKVR